MTFGSFLLGGIQGRTLHEETTVSVKKKALDRAKKLDRAGIGKP